MRKNKLLKLTALVLSAVMLAGAGYTALPVEAEDTISGSYFNFENGDSSVYTAYYNTAEDSVQLETYEDTKAIVTKGTSDTRRCVIFAPPAKNLYPSNVSFRIKFDGIGTSSSYTGLFDFLPAHSDNVILSSNLSNHITRDCMLRFTGRNDTSNTTKDWLKICTAGQDNGTISTATQYSTASAIDGKWLEFNIAYDWSRYTETDGWNIVFDLTISEVGNSSEPLVSISEIVFAPSGNHAAYIQNKSYFSVGMGWGTSGALDDGLTIALDNVGIAWTDLTNTYAPTYIPEPKALGATLATTEGTDGTIKTQMGFKFTDARTALAKNNATVSEYGAVFVAGTKDYETMKKNAASVIGGTAVDGYVKTVKAEADLPDEYRVTITNSDGENIGKRVTAIGYVKTTDGTIYYTGQNTSDDIAQANLNNFSVMSTLKKIFNQKYLVDADTTSLTNALASFNTANGTQYELTNIQNATVDGKTTDEQRTLLKSIHFELYKNYQ